MALPNTAKSAAALTANGPQKLDWLTGKTRGADRTLNPEGQFSIASWGDVRRLTAELEAIADWRDELLRKHRRVVLLWHLGLLSNGDRDTLFDETDDFKAACTRLALSVRSPA